MNNNLTNHAALQSIVFLRKMSQHLENENIKSSDLNDIVKKYFLESYQLVDWCFADESTVTLSDFQSLASIENCEQLIFQLMTIIGCLTNKIDLTTVK